VACSVEMKTMPFGRVGPVTTGYALAAKKRNQSNDWLHFEVRFSDL
jgi:hypothetical protein